MNYRDKIRKAIECPQFGYDHYGEWGTLRLDQRKYIKRLLDELDSADAYILKLYEEAQKQKEVIDKAISQLGMYADILTNNCDAYSICVSLLDTLKRGGVNNG